MVSTLPRLLRVVGWVVVMALLANPLADLLGIKYCQSLDQVARIDGYLRLAATAGVLFLGSSRTHADVIPADVEASLAAAGVETTAYDLGQPGTTVVASVIVLRDALRRRGTPPRIVVLEVSPGALNANNQMLELTLTRYASLPDTLRALANPTLARWALAGTLRGYANLVLAVYRGPAAEPGDAPARRQGARYAPGDGDGPCDSVVDWTPQGRAKSLAYLRDDQSERALADYRITGLPVAALDEAVGITRRRGARLVLLRYPVHEAYRAVYGHGEDREFEAFIEAYARRHQLRYLDLSREMTETSFADHSHLNACGARRLSRLLGDALSASR